MKKGIAQKLLVLVLAFTVFLSPIVTYAVYGVDCPIDSIDPKCQPPTLGDLQTMAVSLIGTAYAMVGVLFVGILMFNGLIYLIGHLEESKYILGATIEDVQKRMTQWFIGLMLVILSYPVVNTLMKSIVGSSECYANLNNPTVQFIFPTVCKKTVLPTASPTPIPVIPTVTPKDLGIQRKDNKSDYEQAGYSQNCSVLENYKFDNGETVTENKLNNTCNSEYCSEDTLNIYIPHSIRKTIIVKDPVTMLENRKELSYKVWCKCDDRKTSGSCYAITNLQQN